MVVFVDERKKTMLNIGCHISVAKGFYKAGKDAVAVGANSFQFFTRNPRGGKAKDIDLEDVGKLNELMANNKFDYLFAHASYTMNLCSDKKNVRDFSKTIFKDDLQRLKVLPKSYYIFHPGSHVGQGSEVGINFIVEALNEVIEKDNQTYILLEGMSGKGSEVGKSIDELKAIIDRVNYNEKIGICIDTCHLYSSGLDIVNNLDGVLNQIDEAIGIERVKAIHLNDSMTEFNSKKDRHEKIGDGTIGLDAITRIINHPMLKDKVFNLETPNELDGYKAEIELLREKYVG